MSKIHKLLLKFFYKTTFQGFLVRKSPEILYENLLFFEFLNIMPF